MTTEDPHANLAEAKAYLDAAQEGEPPLWSIDTQARSLGGMDENPAAAANWYLGLPEELRRGLQCTVLSIAHSSNKENSDGTDFRGSSGFSAGFDAVWTQRRARTAPL
jgi:hypothetical protein